MSIKTSVIHIGLHKTGSTTLQTHLAGSRRLLAEQGFCYPQGRIANKNQHSQLALFLRERKLETYETEFQRIAEEFRRSGCAHLILSGEEFSTLRAESVQRFGGDIGAIAQPVRIILYVRNLFRFMISLIAQYSKGGTFVAYPRSVIDRVRNFNPSQKVKMWEDVFGEGNVTVQCLEAFPIGSSIEEQFAEFAGVKLQPGAVQTLSNRSIDPIASALLTHLSHEFGISHGQFYKDYFDTVEDRFVLPRTEGHMIQLAKGWVEGIDLSHPKLAVFGDFLLTPPAVANSSDQPDMERARKYMETIAAVLLKTAARIKP